MAATHLLPPSDNSKDSCAASDHNSAVEEEACLVVGGSNGFASNGGGSGSCPRLVLPSPTPSCSSSILSPTSSIHSSSSSSNMLLQLNGSSSDDTVHFTSTPCLSQPTDEEEPAEADKVLGVTILAQLQELDIAIKQREKNKVDGRKTRWIEFRKQQEELRKNDSSVTPVSSAKKKRARTVASSKHKKENINSLQKSPAESPEKDKAVPGSPPVNNNNNNICVKIESPSDSMKIEVSEPLVGCVEPSNVLETMKQHFLNDTTTAAQEGPVDGARLTNGAVTEGGSKESSSESATSETVPKKKNHKKDAPAAPVVVKRKVGRPLKKDVKRLTKNLVQKGTTAKENKGKAVKKKITPPVTVAKKVSQNAKCFSISNFFSKQKTRGLREIRKPENETPEKASVESSSNSAAPAIKCPLIAAAAKIVSSNSKKESNKKEGNAKGKLVASSTVASTAKKAAKTSISGNSTPTGPNKQQSDLNKSDSTNTVKKGRKSKLLNETQSSDSEASITVSHSATPQTVSKNTAESTSENSSTDDQVSDISDTPGKRTRGRNGKRKLGNDCDISPVKCSKKTSTVVVEVHNTMNGEPQTRGILPVSSASVASSTATLASSANRKRKTTSPAKGVVPSSTVPSSSSASEAAALPPQPQDACEGDAAELPAASSVASDRVKASAVSNIGKDNLTSTSTESNSVSANDTSKDDVCILNKATNNSNKSVESSTNVKRSTTSSPIPVNSTNSKSCPSSSSSVTATSSSSASAAASSSRKCPSPVVKSTNTSIVSKSLPLFIRSSIANSSKDKNSESKDDKNAPNKLVSLPPVVAKSSEAASGKSSSKVISPTSKTKTSPQAASEKKNTTDTSVVAVSSNSSVPEQNSSSPPAKKIASPVKSVRGGSLRPRPESPAPKPAVASDSASTVAALNGDDNKTETRTKSPTGSDCDNNNSNTEEISLKENGDDKTDKSTTVNNRTDDVTKTKANSQSNDKPTKRPRYLTQLFKDEGVQNMLKSMEEDSAEGSSGVTASDTSHKLRPKRLPEFAMAISPEPDIDITLNTSSTVATAATAKRKRKVNEVDNLFTDEGTLNLLTSMGSSRRPSSLQHEDGSGVKDTTADIEILSVTSNKKQTSTTPPPAPEQALPKATPASNGTVLSNSNQNNSMEVIAIPSSDSYGPAKRKPGRPIKKSTTGNRSKASSPSSGPAEKSSAGLNTSSDGGNNRVNNASSKGTLSTKSSANNSTVVTGATTKATNGASSVGGSNNTASNKTTKHSTAPTSPVKMRRVDLPTSPTAASLKSLVRSLEECADSDNAAVSTSSVAFVTHSRPGTAGDTILPSTRVLRGLMDSTGNTGQGSGGGGSMGGAGAASFSSSTGLRQSQRTSVRHNNENGSVSTQYRDIILRRMNKFVHIIMAPQTTKIKNSLNSRVLRELCDALGNLKNDTSVRLVLVTSNGSNWCQGIDLTSLHHNNAEIRASHAFNLARAIKEFLRMLVQFPKPIIAGVNGSAMGLGVTMLPLFDMVFASDNAEFYLPYYKLGQVPEGGATYTFPNLIGKLQSTRLFMGQKFSAQEGVKLGLVSEVLWPGKFQEALLPKVALLASQSSQSMEATKALMNHHLVTRLELTVESECHTLLKQWVSPQFDTLSRRFLDSHAPLMQKPVPVPL